MGAAEPGSSPSHNAPTPPYGLGAQPVERLFDIAWEPLRGVLHPADYAWNWIDSRIGATSAR